MKELASSDWPRIVPSGGRVFVGSGVSMPRALMESLLEAAPHFEDTELLHVLPLSPLPWLEPRYEEHFRTNTFFLNEELWGAVEAGRADYTPCSFSEIPYLFTAQHLPLDAALIEVSPPDAQGRVSLGANVDAIPAAVRSAKTVVAQVNSCVPRTHGETTLPTSAIDYFIEREEPLPERTEIEVTETVRRIGAYVAQIVGDGCTIHAGPGVISQGVLAALQGHRHLGIHTSLFSAGMMRLVQCGAVDNSRKTYHPGKMVADHCQGTRELYRFIEENSDLELYPCEYVDSPDKIALNKHMVSINDAIVADLTGQAVRDSLGRRFYHGVAEQVDFLRGSAMSEHGRPIIVLASTTSDGKESRIFANLKEGPGVITGRVDVHYVVTEFGIATLYGRTVGERVLEMIQVAHPKFREDLLRKARRRGWVPRFHVRPGSTMVPPAENGLESRTIALGGHPFVLRPLHPTDIRHVQEFFYSHEPETVRLRYGHMMKRMSPERAYELVNVDQSRDLALAILETRGETSVVRAMGGFYLDPNEKSAEVAFVVHEKLRRAGLATTLLRAMAKHARRRGIVRFWAQVDAENRPMLKLFKSFGATRDSQSGDGEVLVTLDIDSID